MRVKVTASQQPYYPVFGENVEIKGKEFEALILSNGCAVIETESGCTWSLYSGSYQIIEESLDKPCAQEKITGAEGIIELFKTMKSANIEFK